MQTFLPYEDFELCAETLDRQRLGKQRVENLQILTSLYTGTGWTHHPAVKMWRGYEGCLMDYHWEICFEWSEKRRYRDSCWHKAVLLTREHRPGLAGPHRPPPWMGDPGFHISHQSNLLRKDPEHYSQFFSNIPDDLPYVWPR